MAKNIIKLLSGYDPQGTVYDAGDSIIRKINSEYFKEIETIYNIYEEMNLHQLGIVKTEIEHEKNLLKHRKHIISYPYEWTANMYKDAVLFHLNLFSALDKSGLTLKDALPNNIVFDFHKPIFVDFISIVSKEKLRDETWLTKNTNYTDSRFAVFDRMFVPYILIPFLAMGKKDYALSRKLLSENACNCGEEVPSWENLLGSGHQRFKSFVKNKIKSFIAQNDSDPIGQAKNLLKSKENLDFLVFNKGMQELVESVDVTPPGSAYASYYHDKNEAFDFEDQIGWTNKQKNIYGLINETKPKRVLDIGANTGWFSIMAEKLGSEVIATDIDESSIDLLYLKAKKEDLKILPLLLSFDDLEKKIFGVSYDEEEYKGRDFENTPLFMPATERINSDVVLCLGLIHHLVLGMGKDIDGVMEVLSKLTEKTLVLEFVSLKDKLIQGDPSFFKNIQSYSEDNYNIDIVRESGSRYFRSVSVMDSEPETRKLIVFSRD